MRERRWDRGRRPAREHNRERLRQRWNAVGLGVRLFWQSLSTVVPLAVATVSLALTFGTGMVFLRSPAMRLPRVMARRQRRLLEREFGVTVPEAYRPEPVVERLPDGRFRYCDLVRKTEPRSWELDLHHLRSDEATWRDFGWLVAAPLLGLLAAAPAALVVFGLAGQVLLPGLAAGYGYSTERLVLLAMLFTGFSLAPDAVRVYRRWSTALLSAPENALLERRVRRLTETRADAVDTQAAELRRIERDLHDGVQARLVAMGLNLGAVEQLMEHDPQAAKALLAQSREASATTLRELRGLVRGIHPPVLAERGLADAIRALALDSPLRVEVAQEWAGRAEPPVESAVYFAVSELLANAARHAEAERVWIDVHHTGEALRVQVTDDGRGGADQRSATGSGLRGIERRLGTFDGVLALSSPPGGPTIVTLELPCALSSPRTSTSSEKA